MGCIQFSDKSGTRVSIEYLKLFEDLGQVSSYAWGVAVLAYLYMKLGYASTGGVKQISEPVLQMGSTGPHTVSTLYHMLRMVIDALDGVETKPVRGICTHSSWADSEGEQRSEHRSKFRHE